MKERLYNIFFFLGLYCLIFSHKVILAKEVDNKDSLIVSLYRNSNYDSITKILHDELVSNDSLDRVDILNQIGEIHWQNHYLDSALYYYEKSISENDFNKELKGESLVGLCKYYLRYGKGQEVKKVLTEIERLNLEKESGKIVNQYLYLSVVYDYLYNGNNFKERVEKILDQIQENELYKIEIYIDFIDLLIEDKQFDLALKYLTIAKKHIIKFHPYHTPYIINLNNNEGYYLHIIGHYKESINVFEKKIYPLLKTFKSNWTRFQRADYLRMSSYPYIVLQNNFLALEKNKKYLNFSIDLFGNNHHRVAETYQKLSRIYANLGFYELSQEYNLKAIEIHEKRQSNYELIISLFNSILIEIDQSNYKNAQKYIDHLLSLEFNSKAELRYKIIGLHYESRIELEKEHYETAVLKSENCVNLAKSELGSTTYQLAQVYSVLFDSYLGVKDEGKALKILDLLVNDVPLYDSFKKYRVINSLNSNANKLLRLEMIDSSLFFVNKSQFENQVFVDNENESIYPSLLNSLSQSLFLKGEIYKKKYKREGTMNFLDSSYHYYNLSVDLIERNRKKFLSQKDKITLNEFLPDAYKNSIETSIKLFNLRKQEKYLTEAFNTHELFKSNLILESLNRDNALKTTNIPDTLQQQINSLKQQNSFLNTQINLLEKKEKLSELDSTQLSDFKSILLENKVAFNDLMLHLEKSYPNYYEANYNPQIATLESVQQNLKPNEALLEYFVGDDGVYAFTITKDTAEVFKLDSLSEQTIKDFQKIIQPENFTVNQNTAYQQYVNQSHALYQKLIEKPLLFISDKGIDKLYIIPDKSLNYLPFELLIQNKPQSKKANYQNLDYLLKEYTISYGYSASILFRENPMAKEREYKGNVLAVAPSYSKILNDTAQLAKLGKFRDGFAELKYNKEEVDGIGKYFDSEILKGDDATEEAFTEKYQNYDIIHLAMHALVDNEESDNSKLVFTPKKDTLYDSYLHNYELYNLNMNPKLAVLSACNTGYGSLASGEGVMSLARAFTYAGAESVVMSHWRVDDEASSTIMQLFYKYLSKGKTKDESLRLAKLDYLASAPATAQHPFHWNNFVILGDVSALKPATSWYQTWWFYVGVVTCLLIMFTLYRKRKVFYQK